MWDSVAGKFTCLVVEFDKLVLELRERFNWGKEEDHDNEVGLFNRGRNKSDDTRNAEDDILQDIIFSFRFIPATSTKILI